MRRTEIRLVHQLVGPVCVCWRCGASEALKVEFD